MPAETTDPRLGTVVAGYRLDERLGAGGMGVVYGAVRVSDGASVAIKFLHEPFAQVPELVKRFDREAAALRLVQHPNLVAILDAGIVDGVPYLVMERLNGKSLGALLEEGTLAIARARRITRQILTGVAAAHERGVVHRDLKPDNILLVGEERDERVKILDFGLARLIHDAGGSVLTHTGFALGTPSYMSPEQARGTPADHRADLYAVGVILYQMVVGHKPFVAESPLAILRMHMDDVPVPPSKAAGERVSMIDDPLERAILRALEKDPAARWQEASEFARALDGDERTRRARRAGTDAKSSPEPAPKPPRKSRAPGLVVVLVALAASAVLAVPRARELAIGYTRPLFQPTQTPSSAPPPPAQLRAPPIGDASVVEAPRVDAAIAVTNAEADDDPDGGDNDSDNDEEVAAPSNTPGVALEAAAHDETVAAQPPRLETARALILGGKIDDGIRMLYRLRKQSPKRAALSLWLGHAYFRKLWRTDALREYAVAIDQRATLRSDPQLLRNAVVALENPTYRFARSILLKHIGKAALLELRRTARAAKNPRLRTRAANLAIELARGRGRKP